MNIAIPELTLVVLVGASSSGKSTFARRHFAPTEVVSSDACRALVADDENARDVNAEAFALVHTIASTRLRLRHLTVIDATSVQRESRRALVALATQSDVQAVAIVFDLPEDVLLERLGRRSDRRMRRHVVHNHCTLLRRSREHLLAEGFASVHVLRSQDEVDAVTIVRERLDTDRRDERGPFDIIGDVHGCHDELTGLLRTLGYAPADTGHTHPAGRRAVFLGDLVNRGPASPAVLRTVMAMVSCGSALCVPGNRDVQLAESLKGREVIIDRGLAESLRQLESETSGFKREVVAFIDGLPSHLVLDRGSLVVVHAGMSEALQGRVSDRVRRFAITGAEQGRPHGADRNSWAAAYRGKAVVVHGHTPVSESRWLNRTICVDTGCVYGGRLTALRYPEMELVSVAALRTYHEPPKRRMVETLRDEPARDAIDPG